MSFLVLILGLLESAGAISLLFFITKKLGGGKDDSLENLKDESKKKMDICEKVENLRRQAVDIEELKKRVQELLVAKESLKAERGRVTISQAELETIEIRLRELDEIARELEASSVETKEEMKILKKKENDLAQKNDNLRQQITDSVQQVSALMGQIEISAQVQEQIDRARTELLSTEGRVVTLLMQIQEGNEQYFILKQRYDALDIEYAQLYEKFSEQQG